MLPTVLIAAAFAAAAIGDLTRSRTCVVRRAHTFTRRHPQRHFRGRLWPRSVEGARA